MEMGSILHDNTTNQEFVVLEVLNDGSVIAKDRRTGHRIVLWTSKEMLDSKYRVEE
jgi:hypothetical protein